MGNWQSLNIIIPTRSGWGFDLKNTGSPGLKIIFGLVKQLSGKYELNSKNGVEFTLKFGGQGYTKRV